MRKIKGGRSMETTVFNNAQKHILKLMSTFKTDRQVEELRDVLSEYYARKAEEELDRLWDEGVLDQKKLDELRMQHLRTPYTPVR